MVTSVFLVPGERIELSWVAPNDFESFASTNSAIPARRTQFAPYQKVSTFYPKNYENAIFAQSVCWC